jgi:signal recognition particle receptor subunit beta
MTLDEIKVAVLGESDEIKSNFINNLIKKKSNFKKGVVTSGFEVSITTVNGKRIYLFGAPSSQRESFFDAVLPEGIDLGIVIVDSSKGITSNDKKIIEEVKGRKMPCMVFFNDSNQNEFHNFGRSIVHGSAEKTKMR